MALFWGRKEKVACAGCGSNVNKVTSKDKDALFGNRSVGEGFHRMALKCNACGKALCPRCVAPVNPLPSNYPDRLQRQIEHDPEFALKACAFQLVLSAHGGKAVCPSCGSKEVGLFMTE